MINDIDNDNDSSNNNDRPTNLVQFESYEVKHKFGLDKFPDVPTESLVVAALNIIKSIDAPSHSRQSDIQFLALQYWAEMCVEMLDIRIKALNNRIGE
jgi:hypothetical protein